MNSLDKSPSSDYNKNYKESGFGLTKEEAPMKHNFRKQRTVTQYFQEFVSICRCAAASLGISEGEFWVWYGNPFILQNNSHK